MATRSGCGWQHSLGSQRHGTRKFAEDSLHHGQVLEIVVCLKSGFAGEELQKNAAHAPQIARVSPTQSEDDLLQRAACQKHARAEASSNRSDTTRSRKNANRRTVVPRRDDGRVVLGFVGRAAKINHHNVLAFDNA